MRFQGTRPGRAAIVGSLALAGMLAAPAVHAYGVMTKEFKKGETRTAKVVILPPYAEFHKAKAIMREEMMEECIALERATAKWLAAKYEERGYEPVLVTMEQIEADPELAEMFRRVNARYDQDFPKLMRKPKKVKKKQVDLGEEGRHLAAMLDADTLAIIRVRAVQTTGGKKALGFLFGGVAGAVSSRSNAGVFVATMHGRSGLVESFFWGYDRCKSRALVEEPDTVIRKASNSCFKKFPKLGEVVAEDDDSSEMSEEELLRQFEEEEGQEDGGEADSDGGTR